MKIFSQDLLWTTLNDGSEQATLTIVPTVGGVEDYVSTVSLEADGYTTVTGTGRQSITVAAGADVVYTIEKSNYNTATNSVVVYKNQVVNIPLSNRAKRTITIHPTPSTATVKIENLDVQGEVFFTTTAQIAEGYHVRVTLINAGLQDFTDEFVVGADNIEKYLEMLATVSISNTTPSTATKVLSLDNTYQNPNYTGSITIPCTTQAIYWQISAGGYIPNSGVVIPTDNRNYLVDTVLVAPDTVLNIKPLSYTVRARTPNDADVTITIYNPHTGLTRTVTGTGETTATCYIDEVITWEVSKQYYITQTSVSSTTMIDNDLQTDYIDLQQAVNYAHVYCNPSNGTVRIYINNIKVSEGVGEAQYPVPLGTTITYDAEFAGVTSPMSNPVFIDYATPNFSDTVVLNPQDATSSLITSTETRVLQPGKYYYVAVGAGAGGAAGKVTSAQTWGNFSYLYAGHGGNGGGSGYISYGSFTLTEAKQVTFNIGVGGRGGSNTISSAPASGAPTGGGNTTVTIAGDETPIVVAEGGKTSQYPAGTSGGDGGNGGGAFGFGELRRSNAQSSETTNAVAGGNGGKGGGNGATNVNNVLGGVGYYNSVVLYENNGGAAATSSTVAQGGLGGVGLSAISSTITPTFLANMNTAQLQVLYNAMSAGGGGGGATFSSSQQKGAGGGGGAGWTNGANGHNAGTAADDMLGGAGGDGAIIIARYAWS